MCKLTRSSGRLRGLPGRCACAGLSFRRRGLADGVYELMLALNWLRFTGPSGHKMRLIDFCLRYCKRGTPLSRATVSDSRPSTEVTCPFGANEAVV
jgi:hypothetical protein